MKRQDSADFASNKREYVTGDFKKQRAPIQTAQPTTINSADQELADYRIKQAQQEFEN